MARIKANIRRTAMEEVAATRTNVIQAKTW